MITLTEKAAKHIQSLREQEGIQEPYLRISITKGGCSGYEYGMGFDEKMDDDITFESASVQVTIDPHSAEILKGITVDYNDGLHGKGFEFFNPNAKHTCGCGKSFH